MSPLPGPGRRWIVVGLGLLALVIGGGIMARQQDPTGAKEPPSEQEAHWRDELRRDVVALARGIGERNYRRPEKLAAAADWLEQGFRAAGLAVERQPAPWEGRPFVNVVAEVAGHGRPGSVVVVGAHYDTVVGSPGADDNGSGVAVLMALSRAFARTRPERTLRFVGFVNEEPPAFQSDAMGSWQAAQGSRAAGERVVAMLSLETLGYYSDEPDSQQFPDPALARRYPTTGNFLAFVANEASQELLDRATEAFGRRSALPVEGAVLPAHLPGVGWSDHWSYWQAGYPALMVTDTAPFRNPHYHMASDTPETLDYARMARAVTGLQDVLRALAGVAEGESGP